MHAILNHSRAEDFVISTGESHSVREFLEIAFGTLGLDYEKYLVIDPKFFRPSEETILRGDCSKAKNVLNWESEITFEQLVTLMTEADFQLLKSKH